MSRESIRKEAMADLREASEVEAIDADQHFDRIKERVDEGKAVEDMIKSDGFSKVLGPYLQSLIDDAKDSWKLSDTKERDAACQKGQLAQELFNWLNSRMNLGSRSQKQFDEILKVKK